MLNVLYILQTMRNGIIFAHNVLNCSPKNFYKKYLFKLNIEAKLYEKLLINSQIYVYCKYKSQLDL